MESISNNNNLQSNVEENLTASSSNFRASRPKNRNETQIPISDLNDYDQQRGSGSMAFRIRPDEALLTHIVNSEAFETVSEQQELADFQSIRELSTSSYTYYGETEFSSRNGFGVCYYPDNSKYTGQWVDNRQQGMGKLCKGNLLYEGEFKNNKPNGYMNLTTREGISYEGLMKNFLFLANSPLVVRTKTSVIEIIPERDLDTTCLNSEDLEGLARVQNKDKSYYEGHMTGLYQNKLGIFRKENLVFRGSKACRRYNGYCEISYKDGTKFFGNFKENKKDGLGFFFSPDQLLNVAIYTANNKNGGSITRKFDKAIQSEVFVYENWHQGWRSQKLDNKQAIEEYIREYYPEQLQLLQLNFQALVKLFTCDQ
eukprot:CAMPEP_0170515884 /NCGR_PEP_ID=MMETSP0209-20121228/2270_1 /TAXON_ID=665100 ORGANISM="Litonotus pictus, Strain P1" /NCGR_SAMPLE_ID=MMETSP0209 /ASSEMBLY_ACC=CAM_ASM_000301 /LENGTH=369 /DNA_ID=CAMNT_0010800587 /DNA_START=28 /DNA_END=1137 /DNA_ORIENTATION=+